MQGRYGAASAFRQAGLALSLIVFLGHFCTPPGLAHLAGEARQELAVSSDEFDTAHDASCEVATAPSAARSVLLAVESPAPSVAPVKLDQGIALQPTPDPVPHPPLFLLHAALLN